MLTKRNSLFNNSFNKITGLPPTGVPVMGVKGGMNPDRVIQCPTDARQPRGPGRSVSVVTSVGHFLFK